MKNILLSFFLTFLSLEMSAQNIGIQLYSVRNQVKTDLKGTLQKVRNMGISQLEGGELYGMDLKSYKALLDQFGFKMVSIGADYDELNKDLSPLIEKAKNLGAKYVVCFWIGHNGNEFGIKDVEEAANRFNQAGKILKEAGLSLCYHPHGFEFRKYDNKTLFDVLIDKTNPDYLNFELDVYWAKQGCSDPVELLKKYPKRFSLIHLKDRLIGTKCDDTGHADEETNVVLGSGDVNIKGIMNAAKKSNVKYFFIEDESSRVMDQVPLSLKYLKSLK